jgi:hypothetical protein
LAADPPGQLAVHRVENALRIVALAVVHGYSVGFEVAAGIFLGAAVICALLLRKPAVYHSAEATRKCC